jgi:hypothetical protein
MRIVEEDFVMEPAAFLSFDLTLLSKVKDKETGELKTREKVAYGCSLSNCIRMIIRHRLNTKFESESPYLLDALNELIKLNKEILNLCKE